MNTSASNAEPDFSEFMWMAEEDLEAFDRKVLCEVSQVVMECASNLRDDEEEFLEGMLQEEEERDTVYYHQYYHDKLRNDGTANLTQSMNKLVVKPETAAKSNLNPYAAEFVPRQNPSQRTTTQTAPMGMTCLPPSGHPPANAP
ncbi:hypothetical protein Pmani_003594 [Petrolisthes manimaculis]|uniref:Uncharacterized protein n=1 Tax=Petrolisthes manimaculis TaxID=1843537 RepID=A0AAE1QFX5_9EUCA|nr:hypothetical protein Pmani_003594 [Petrolisthes manimaculis]